MIVIIASLYRQVPIEPVEEGRNSLGFAAVLKITAIITMSHTIATSLLPAAPSTAMSELTATLQTSEGDIEIELYDEKVPNTVENFVGLATGEKEWEDPETGETKEKPLYDDIPVHRVIDDFMVQMGDPTGTGKGGPGYTFDDEFHPDLRHDEAGIVSMANRGPNTNGSQFFITLGPQPHLDDKHAVFGKVIDGMDVVEEIGAANTGPQDKPKSPIHLEAVEVHR